MRHHCRREEEKPDRDSPKTRGEDPYLFRINFLAQKIEKDNRERCKERIHDPGGSQQKAQEQHERIAWRVLAVPLSIVDHMTKIEEFFGCWRRGIKMS